MRENSSTIRENSSTIEPIVLLFLEVVREEIELAINIRTNMLLLLYLF
jgi:hypothetical protein